MRLWCINLPCNRVKNESNKTSGEKKCHRDKNEERNQDFSAKKEKIRRF